MRRLRVLSIRRLPRLTCLQTPNNLKPELKPGSSKPLVAKTLRAFAGNGRWRPRLRLLPPSKLPGAPKLQAYRAALGGRNSACVGSYLRPHVGNSPAPGSGGPAQEATPPVHRSAVQRLDKSLPSMSSEDLLATMNVDSFVRTMRLRLVRFETHTLPLKPFELSGDDTTVGIGDAQNGSA